MGIGGLLFGIGLLGLSGWLPRTASGGPPPFVLDGEFDEWEGVQVEADAFGDSTSHDADIKLMKWGVNPHEPFVYFLVERYTTDGLPFDETNGQAPSVRYRLQISKADIEAEDGESPTVTVTYLPKKNRSRVRVDIDDGGEDDDGVVDFLVGEIFQKSQQMTGTTRTMKMARMTKMTGTRTMKTTPSGIGATAGKREDSE